MSIRLTNLIVITFSITSSTQAHFQQDDAISEGVVEAQKFVLKDEDGTIRAEFGIRGGGPHISLLNRDGSVGATLNLEDNGRGLVILGPNGEEQIAMGKTSVQQNYYLNIQSSDGTSLFSVPAATAQKLAQDNSSSLIATAIAVAGICIGTSLPGNFSPLQTHNTRRDLSSTWAARDESSPGHSITVPVL